MISKIIIGTWPLSGDYGKIDYNQIKDVLEYSYESGIREFDSAPNYGNGVMEKYLGIIFENRSDVKKNKKMGNLPFNKKNYDFNKDIIPIDWTLGYFESGATLGFNYSKKREGQFLENLAKKYKIK